jgi:FMN phosphatase YigB (HAD superfamily)
MIYVEPDKTILVDCDGVLLDWEYAFHAWMTRHGYKAEVFGEYKMNVKYGIEKAEASRLCRMFNESATIRKLPPLRDAIKYIRKLHEEHGYVFHAVTSLSDDQYAQHLRTKNLIELFGPTAFERYTYLDTGADKDEALAEYKGSGCYWVEDKPENVDVGIKLGLEGILMKHEHNAYYKGDAVRVNNWKEIYDLIVN